MDGKISQGAILNEELQALNGSWERENQPYPGMSPWISIQSQVTNSKHIFIEATQRDSAGYVYIYTCYVTIITQEEEVRN